GYRVAGHRGKLLYVETGEVAASAFSSNIILFKYDFLADVYANDSLPLIYFLMNEHRLAILNTERLEVRSYNISAFEDGAYFSTIVGVYQGKIT
ncbi:hypothetical protein PFISCL1PPCAC_17031, partial [Pristionchus fissidentatus]